MNYENPPGSEQEQEHIPTPEEVHSVFKELTNKEYKETRRCEDEQGLYLLEVIVPGDEPEEEIEYQYMRKGRYPEGESGSTEICVTYYENKKPISGTSAARCVDGKWKLL